MLLFMLIMVVMLYLSILTLLQSTSSMNLSDPVAFLATSAGRDTVIGLGSTFGLYWASSLLFLDPWHMLTSFVQYLLLLPSYINILQVYGTPLPPSVGAPRHHVASAFSHPAM